MLIKCNVCESDWGGIYLVFHVPWWYRHNIEQNVYHSETDRFTIIHRLVCYIIKKYCGLCIYRWSIWGKIICISLCTKFLNVICAFCLWTRDCLVNNLFILHIPAPHPHVHYNILHLCPGIYAVLSTSHCPTFWFKCAPTSSRYTMPGLLLTVLIQLPSKYDYIIT